MEELLIKCANDPDVPLIAKGLFLEMAYASDPGLATSQNQDMMNLLLDMGYLDHDGSRYFVVGNQYGDDDLAMAWKAFYHEYPGRKLGVNKELALFKAKYSKGKWRRIVVTLFDHVQRQINEREVYQHAMDRQIAKGNRNHNMFLPGWKNMKTYINQEAWNEEFPTPAQFLNEPEAQEPVQMQAGSPYERYFNWAKAEAETYNLSNVIRDLVLTESDFNDILNAVHPDFSGYRQYMTVRAMGEVMKIAQQEYFKTVSLRHLYPKFINYLKWEYVRAKG